MSHLSSPAIMLRTIDHGDYDMIITFFTRDRGKVSLIAKGAKKSVRRFAGILELFSALNLVWTRGKEDSLPILQEASVVQPFEQIRTDIVNTAYASYWCELVCQWMEQGQKQQAVYELLEGVLGQLNTGKLSEEVLHITFQLRFIALSGFGPCLEHCTVCRTPLDQFGESSVGFSVEDGGILCKKCDLDRSGHLCLSVGTVKFLRWVLNVQPEQLHRIRFSRKAIEESLNMLEAFVPYHLGKETKSSKFLKQLTTRPGR